MENKKTLGAYICRRRKELGMTQKEFAQRLFVTESAVSKWERGLSYPDITMVRSICELLEISEHELLTASEDTESRNAQRLAGKYLRLLNTYRLVQYIFYGAIAFGCLLGNLLAQHTLSWFWIAVSVELLFASLTLVPALVEHHKTSAVIGTFTVSLLLILLASCLYSGGTWFFPAAVTTLLSLSVLLLPAVLRDLPLPPPLDGLKRSLYLVGNTALLILTLEVWCLYSGGTWFAVAAASVLFGAALVFLPFILRQLPLKNGWERRKTTLYLAAVILFLLLLLLVSCVSSNGTWFAIAAASVLFGAALIFLPLVLRQMPLKNGWERRKTTLYLTTVTALLLLLLFICCLYSHGTWFLVAAPSVLLGITVPFLPIPLHQLPLPQPLCRHKAVLYGTVESLLLIFLLAICCWQEGGTWFWMPGMPITLYCLLLPWSCLLLVRYLPTELWTRIGGCFLVLTFYVFASNWVLERLLLAAGIAVDDLHDFGLHPDFSNWSDVRVSSENILTLIALSLLALAALCFTIGALRSIQKRRLR